MSEPDIIVIGAGPAGMAAASLAGEKGASVMLLDEQMQAGGQIYRDVERSATKRASILGKDYIQGIELTNKLSQSNIKFVKGAQIWMVKANGLVAWSQAGVARMAKAKRIIVATGALERPMPIPGWTKPGVMTVGAAQIMLKQSGLVVERAVLVGSGPLLYLTAQQMVLAGKPPLALVETQTRSDLLAAMPHFIGALKGWKYLTKGISMLRTLRRAGVKRYTAAKDLRVVGENEADGVSFVCGGQRITLKCDTVLLHQGVVPNVQISRSLKLEHLWNADQVCFIPVLNKWGKTELDHIYITGDGGGIGGAKAAEIAGRLAALDALASLGQITAEQRNQHAASMRSALDLELAARPFIDRAYPPVDLPGTIHDDTIICRCEEVRAGDIKKYVKIGCKGPNQTKAFGRCGMGPCQGRYCGLSVTQLLASENDQTCDETGYYHIRQPLKPITLGELATMESAAEAAELEFEE